MKVISGIHKGRNLKGYNILGTRPTQARVKESLFSMIQDKLNDSVFLDLFAGSGAIGIEAISNGAKKVYFVDNNKICINTIKENVNLINEQEKSIILKNDYMEILKHFKEQKITFDLIFIDPPYKDKIIDDIFKKIINYQLLNTGGQVIIEFQKEKIETTLTLIKEKKYGDKLIYIYEKR